MSLSTFPSRYPDRTGIRWRASADVFSKVQGSRYTVFRGRMFSSLPNAYSNNKKGVVKIHMAKTVSQNDWSYYLRCSREANDYAILFTELVPPGNKMLKVTFVASCVAAIDKVSFPALATKLVRNLKRTPEKNEYVLIEELISGRLKLFNSRNHKILRCDLEYLEAFSHFTYWKSNGEHIVCDMKGVHDGNEFLFTCPSIHSRSKTFGPDDLGNSGIRRFFSNHQCGKICQPWANCVWRRGSPPPYPTSNPTSPYMREQSGEFIPPSTQYSASSIDIQISTLAADEAARPCVSPVSEVSQDIPRSNMATLLVPRTVHRRRALSDHTDLPPPYSEVAHFTSDSQRHRSNSCTPMSDLQIEAPRIRHWSDSDYILRSNISTWTSDILPSYDAVIASFAALGTRPVVDNRMSVRLAADERVGGMHHHGDEYGLCPVDNTYSSDGVQLATTQTRCEQSSADRCARTNLLGQQQADTPDIANIPVLSTT